MPEKFKSIDKTSEKEITHVHSESIEKLPEKPIDSIPQEDQFKIEQELQKEKAHIERAEAGRLLHNVSTTIEQVNNIESQVEVQQLKSEEPQKKKGIKNFFRNATIMIVTALFGLSTAYEVSLKLKEEREGQTIERNIGFDLKGLAEKHGFKTELQIDNGNEKHVIHIGQIHKSDKSVYDESPTNREKIIEVQKGIEELILELQNQGVVDKTVFLEGVTHENVDDIKHLEKSYAGNKLSVNFYASLVRSLAEDLKKDKSTHLLMADYFYLTKIEEMEKQFEKNPPVDISSAYRDFNDYKAKHPEVNYNDYLKKHPELEDAIFLKGAREIIKQLRSEELLEKMKDEYRYYGGAHKLFIDGKISVKGAEDKEVYERSGSLMREAEITGKRSSVIQDHQKEFLTDRENAAVRILSSDAGKESKATLLVYGKGHDFRKATQEHNDNNPNHKLGLIRIVPKTQKKG